MMEKATAKQLQQIHAALHRLGLLYDKANIVETYTGNRTRSSREMTTEEAEKMLGMLNAGLKINSEEKEKKDKMVRHMIAMAHEMGWIKKGTRVTGGKLQQYNDYSPLYEWVEKYGYLKKELNKYSYKELPKLVTQFKNLYADWLNKKR